MMVGLCHSSAARRAGWSSDIFLFGSAEVAKKQATTTTSARKAENRQTPNSLTTKTATSTSTAAATAAATTIMRLPAPTILGLRMSVPVRETPHLLLVSTPPGPARNRTPPAEPAHSEGHIRTIRSEGHIRTIRPGLIARKGKHTMQRLPPCLVQVDSEDVTQYQKQLNSYQRKYHSSSVCSSGMKWSTVQKQRVTHRKENPTTHNTLRLLQGLQYRYKHLIG
jgi:hypothetical protein